MPIFPADKAFDMYPDGMKHHDPMSFSNATNAPVENCTLANVLKASELIAKLPPQLHGIAVAPSLYAKLTQVGHPNTTRGTGGLFWCPRPCRFTDDWRQGGRLLLPKGLVGALPGAKRI